MPDKAPKTGRYVKVGDIEEWVWDDQDAPAPAPVTTAQAPQKPTAKKSPAKK